MLKRNKIRVQSVKFVFHFDDFVVFGQRYELLTNLKGPGNRKKHSDRWLNGKSNHHFAAGSIAGIYSDLPSEPLYDDAADVQAKSGARFEVIYFGETFEHPFLLVGRDADAAYR